MACGPLPFDRVVVTDAPTEGRTLSPTELMRMPLPSRVRLVLQGQLRFFCGESVIDTQAALHALRVATSKLAASARVDAAS
jgi:hypothetical protein